MRDMPISEQPAKNAITKADVFIKSLTIFAYGLQDLTKNLLVLQDFTF
jgi:hypothetical protein